MKPPPNLQVYKINQYLDYVTFATTIQWFCEYELVKINLMEAEVI